MAARRHRAGGGSKAPAERGMLCTRSTAMCHARQANSSDGLAVAMAAASAGVLSHGPFASRTPADGACDPQAIHSHAQVACTHLHSIHPNTRQHWMQQPTPADGCDAQAVHARPRVVLLLLDHPAVHHVHHAVHCTAANGREQARLSGQPASSRCVSRVTRVHASPWRTAWLLVGSQATQEEAFCADRCGPTHAMQGQPAPSHL